MGRSYLIAATLAAGIAITSASEAKLTRLEILEREAADVAGRPVPADGFRGGHDPCAIDQHPLLAMHFARLGKGRGHPLIAGHVDFTERSADVARDLLAALTVSVEYGDLRAPRR